MLRVFDRTVMGASETTSDEPPEYKYISCESDGGVATLRFERPKKKNAIHREMRSEIRTALDRFDRGDDVVLVLTGSDDSFSAGTDIEELAKRTPETLDEAMALEPYSLPERVAAVDKPVLAMLNGVALGGGLELALACDFRVAGDDVRLGFPEIDLGGMPGEGGTQRLPQFTSVGTALRLLFTGELIDAERARREGLVEEVYPASDLETRTDELATTIAEKDVVSLKLVKRAVYAADRTEFETGLDLETLLANVVEIAPGRKERVRSFLEE
jgi:enoyl-CoA hydratase/carnithine racemase